MAARKSAGGHFSLCIQLSKTQIRHSLGEAAGSFLVLSGFKPDKNLMSDKNMTRKSQ